MTSPKGFASWTPNRAKTARSGKSNIELLAEVQDTINHYRHEWPLTQRAWLYRLKTRYGWAKSWEPNLNTILGRGRRAGLIPFEAVTSGRGSAIRFNSCRNANSMVDVAKELPQYLNIDLQEGQERRVVLWIETEGYIPRLAAVAKEYGADVISGSGFDTLSDKYEFAQLIARLGAVTILHFGDLDGSGEVMAREGLYADVSAFVQEMGGNVLLDRIAVLDEHIDRYNLSWEPYKPNGSKHRFSGSRVAEAEALEVHEAQEIVREAFEKHLDMNILNSRKVEQEEVREDAMEILSRC